VILFVSDYSKQRSSPKSHSPDPLRIAFQIPSRDTPLGRREALTWRAVAVGERVLAGILIALLLPALTVFAAIIVVLSRRSPLVAHCRVGQNGQTLWVLKLRTMWDDTTPQGSVFVEKLPLSVSQNFALKSHKDPRVKSSFAAACRRHSVDELPQLWHVLRGEMALIGPRPLTWGEIHRYYGSTMSEFLAQKPGISGLWQVRGRSRLTYHQRRRLDFFMIRQWSLYLYLRILLATVPAVLTGRNAW